jgi:hypothetical protein
VKSARHIAENEFMFIDYQKIKIMNKKKLGGIAILVIACVAAFNVSLNSQNGKTGDISLANSEALADGEKGISVEYCYRSVSFAVQNGRKKICDSRTNDSMIYPCPTFETYGGYSESGRDRCIK